MLKRIDNNVSGCVLADAIPIEMGGERFERNATRG